MITIQILNETGKKVSFSLSAESLGMISRFLHYISYANNDLYDDSSELHRSVEVFYNSDYDPSLFSDAKFLKYMFDLFIERLF